MKRALAAILVLLAATAAQAQSLVITTFAGGGVGDGVLATDASIDLPTGLAVARNGDVYIADQGYHRIRKVERTTGIISTVAGTGDAGLAGDGGPASRALLSSPSALLFDASGNLFVADSGNDRIRRIDAITGVIATFAGGGDDDVLEGVGDGAIATRAVLRFPSALAMDAAQTSLYVADQYNARVRRIDLSTSVIETVAGNGKLGFGGDGGPATQAPLNNPAGIALAANGDLFIADQYNARIRRVDARSGLITTIAGGARYGFGGDGGPAAEATLFFPAGLAIAANGDLLVADPLLSRVRRISASTGRIDTVAGNGAFDYFGDEGTASEAALNAPSGMAFDAAGNLFIADQENGVVREVAAADGTIRTIAGNWFWGPFIAGEGGDARQALMSLPLSLAFDRQGDLHVSERGNRHVRKVSSRDGTISTVAGGGTRSTGGFGCFTESPAVGADLNPTGIGFDPRGRLYVALDFYGMVCLIDDMGAVIPFAGNPFGENSEFFGTNGDGGPASEAGFSEPYAIAFAPNGDAYIADKGVSRIRRVAAGDGVITTFAGTGLDGYTGDGGPARQARLNTPRALAYDPAGLLFIADTENHRIRAVDLATGLITTIAGTGVRGFRGDGANAVSAQLSGPEGLALDAQGNLYVADTGNHRIRKVVRATGVITTIAGNGEAGFAGDEGDALAASLYMPTGLAFDAAGNLYVADFYNNRVRRISPGLAAP